jgi:PAS domain S-box-containing protein
MSDAASFDAIMQCNLLEVFCEALDAAIFVTDKLDQVSFASVRLMHLYPIGQGVIAPGTRARDLYGALFDAGCRFGTSGTYKERQREDWIAERITVSWKERSDTIEPSGPDRWFHIVSRRFSSGLGLTVIQDVSEHKKKEQQWRLDLERIHMTEEILDTLPIAVAVKDRNLNFAAVNQQFCKMAGVTPENVLGRGIWDMFEAELAASIEEADWHLLATGDDREAIIAVDRPKTGSVSFLHRARRVGKPGNHYISMSFDEFPVDRTAGMPSLQWKRSAQKKLVSKENSEGKLIPEDRKYAKPHRVVYVQTSDETPTIVADAALRGIELCIIRTENEFTAFLPAIEEAGITLDLVVTEPNASFVFATLSAKHGVRHRMLSPGANVLESIIDALERPRQSPAPTVTEPALNREPPAAEKKSYDIDVLAVEDNPINRLVIEQILESLGLNFLVAPTGSEAIDKIAECRPRVALIDVTLPDMEIDAFVRKLKAALTERRIQPPIIGVISSDGADQRLMCKNAGMTDVLAKPLSPEAIDRILRKHLFHEPESGSSLPKSVA